MIKTKFVAVIALLFLSIAPSVAAGRLEKARGGLREAGGLRDHMHRGGHDLEEKADEVLLNDEAREKRLAFEVRVGEILAERDMDYDEVDPHFFSEAING